MKFNHTNRRAKVLAKPSKFVPAARDSIAFPYLYAVLWYYLPQSKREEPREKRKHNNQYNLDQNINNTSCSFVQDSLNPRSSSLFLVRSFKNHWILVLPLCFLFARSRISESSFETEPTLEWCFILFIFYKKWKISF